MAAYLTVGIICFLLGYYAGNKKFRYKINTMIASFRQGDDDDYYDDDED